MRITTFDMALRTGWATNRPWGVDYGEINLKPCAPALGPRLVNFERELRDVLAHFVPNEIWMERPVGFGRTSWADLNRGLQAVVVLEATKRQIPCHTVMPASLKKWSTGNGRCGKLQMIAAARKFAGIADGRPVTDNEADAICLLAYALEHADGGPYELARSRAGASRITADQTESA